MVTRTYHSKPHWQRWLSLVKLPLRQSRRQRSTARLSHSRASLYALMGLALVLWQTDSQLLLATLSGVGTVWLLARWKQGLYEYGRQLQVTLAQGLQHPLAITVAAGAIACLGTYTLTHLWQSSTDHWLVIALVLQGVLLLALLTMLGMMAGQQQQQQFHRWLADLSHDNPLQRLIAIRQLAHLTDTRDRRCAQEALYLLLNQEKDPLVRRAALAVLDQLDDNV